MKKLLHFIYDILALVNVLTLLAMWACGYVTTLSPVDYPDLSYVGMVFPAFLAVNLCFLVFWLIFQRKVLLVSLLGMLPSYGYIRTYWPVNFSTEPPEGSLKFMSYNTMGFGGLPLDSANEVVQYIMNSNSDIVCLIESNIDSVQARVTFGEQYPYCQAYSIVGNSTTVLSRFPILTVERIEYPSASNHSVACDIDLGSDTLCVIANHFESYQLSEEDKTEYKEMMRHPKEESNVARFDSLTAKLKAANVRRVAQVDSVLAYMERRGYRRIVCCGDFNDPSLSNTHHRLTQNLNDAYTQSGNGPGISYNRSGMYFRIDNILVSPDIAAYGAKVDNYSTVSDHFPIFSYLKIGGK